MKIIVDKLTALKAIFHYLNLGVYIGTVDNLTQIIPDHDITFDFERHERTESYLTEIKFKECSLCSEKSGFALLCDSCISNRNNIEALKEMSR